MPRLYEKLYPSVQRSSESETPDVNNSREKIVKRYYRPNILLSHHTLLAWLNGSGSLTAQARMTHSSRRTRRSPRAHVPCQVRTASPASIAPRLRPCTGSKSPCCTSIYTIYVINTKRGWSNLLSTHSNYHVRNKGDINKYSPIR